MNLIPFAVLTLCIHSIFGQENANSGVFFKSPRSLTINRNSNFELNQQRVSVEDTSDEFSIKKPVVQDKPYSDFLSFLYRNDKAKSKVKREIKTSGILNSDTVREKRMIVFRPLFVYKQQEIKRQRVQDQRKKKLSKKPTKPSKQG